MIPYKTVTVGDLFSRYSVSDSPLSVSVIDSTSEEQSLTDNGNVYIMKTALLSINLIVIILLDSIVVSCFRSFFEFRLLPWTADSSSRVADKSAAFHKFEG